MNPAPQDWCIQNGACRVEPGLAAGSPGADARVRERKGLGGELLIKRAVDLIVLIGAQGNHDQRPFLGAETQARFRNTISQKRRIRGKRARGQFTLRNTGKKAF